MSDTRISASTLTDEHQSLLTQLAASRDALLTAAHEGHVSEDALRDLANEHASLAARLHLMPTLPAAHVRAAHVRSRAYLERLPRHDPARLVVADAAHSYTPRKVLRRVLDHAIDHLNQIEQWRRWQERDIAPVATDGWASSAETFGEDVQPLSGEELAAWLWRIDLTVEMAAQQAENLSDAELDWTPPDGSWTLRHMLHHLAQAELYYAVWIDEPLPDEPLARYTAVSERVAERLRAVFGVASDSASEGERLVLFTESGDAVTTGEAIARGVLATERGTLAQP